jgi:hypothetical protein
VGTSPLFGIHKPKRVNNGRGYANVTLVPPGQTNCPLDCSNPPPNSGAAARGTCDQASGLCHCNPGFLGPACSLYNYTSGAQAWQLSPANGLTLTAMTVGDTTHFRLDSTQKNWMSVMVMNASDEEGLRVGDAVTAHMDQATQKWVLTDQFGHNFEDNPVNDTIQNLLFPAVWMSPKGLVATWSRKLHTKDALQDQVITSGW